VGAFEGGFAVIYDQTERDLATTELSIARRLISCSSTILYRVRLEDGFPAEYVSANVDRFGYRSEDFVGGRLTWSRVLHEDDRERAIAEISAHITAGTRSFLQSYRIRTAAGTVAWVEDQTIVQPRPGSAGFWLEGVITDVTEHYRARGEMRNALAQSIRAVGAVIDRRDPYTGTHQRRVAALSAAIGRRMRLESSRVEGLYLGSLVHDLGKIAIPAEILGKPGRVTDEEYALLRTHVAAGLDILKDTVYPWPIIEIIAQHHERLDGSGYPKRLIGAQITLEARIVAVADVFEAMSGHRPYRPALGIPAALAELVNNRGTRYDRLAVDACASTVSAHGSADELWAALDQGAAKDPTVIQRILDLSIP
jgi:PAS domain S-box-containing protein